MRRKEKAITDQNELIAILKTSKICRLALADENTPYIVPLNYGYKDNALYIHSALSGKKLDLIKKNKLVCFEIESNVKIVPSNSACKYSTHYKCIIGLGRAELIHDRGSIKEALDIIMHHQTGRNGWSYSEESANKVMIIKIAIESMTGKKSE